MVVQTLLVTIRYFPGPINFQSMDVLPSYYPYSPVHSSEIEEDFRIERGIFPKWQQWALFKRRIHSLTT